MPGVAWWDVVAGAGVACVPPRVVTTLRGVVVAAIMTHMEWLGALEAEGYLGARWLVQRGIALVYVLAFVNVLHQWRPLLGDAGLTPAREVLEGTSWRRAPSLFHLRYSDRLATALAWLGLVVAVSLLLGLPQAGPVWAPMAAFAALWALNLSFVTIGRAFYAFGWESLLLEAGFLAIFLGSSEVAPSWVVLLAYRWLLFRVEFGAGMIKLRGDACWRQLTCTEHHHETQPLPNPLSRRFHHLPRWQHRVEVGANHVTQLVVPLALFLPQPVAGVAATIMIVTQAYLMLSGNFAWLNLLTIVLATAALPDDWLGWLPVGAPTAATPTWFAVLTVALGLLVVWRSWQPIANLLSPRQRMNASHDPLRLVNSYGAFGSVTRQRYELVIEATADDPASPQARWRAYELPAKPTDPERRPPQIAPYHLRLDWLLWFAAMSPSPDRHRWFVRLLQALLAADPQVLRLLRHDPLDGARPVAVRVRRGLYQFTTRAQKRSTGRWWHRGELQVVIPPVRAREHRRPGRSDG